MKYFLPVPVLLLFISSCSTTKNANRGDDGKIEINFVQVNDVYEIAPLSGGKEGGMARVATLKKKYEQKNLNSIYNQNLLHEKEKTLLYTIYILFLFRSRNSAII